MNKEAATERLTETENLTADLEDADANWLIDWGIGQLDPLVLSIADDDQADEKLAQLMAVMRSLGKIAAHRANRDPSLLTDDIKGFLSQYATTFGKAAPLNAIDIAFIIAKNASSTPQEAMHLLLTCAAGTLGDHP